MKNLFILTLLSLLIIVGVNSCGTDVATKGDDPNNLTEAKGYYLEGDKKYKIQRTNFYTDN